MNDYLTLRDDNEIPPIGFGTWKLAGDEAQQAVQQAIRTGYRLIDTAAIYGNEREVGQGIKDSGASRDELFVTTKLWSDDFGYELSMLACDTSLDKLGLDYLDLYLIHWPASGKRLDAWRGMIELQKSGRVKSIGVSNFTIEHLQELMDNFGVLPAVNQVELHPHIFAQQRELLKFCDDNDIVVEAYSPLAQGDLLDDPVVEDVARLANKTPAQVLLRWAIEHGTVPIPKSGSKERIAENFEVFDFELSDQDMDLLDSISSGDRVTHDPAEHE